MTDYAVLWFCFKFISRKIQENATIKLREYDYSNPISAMNNYMQANMKNNQVFFAYREEENSIYSAFAFNEKNTLWIQATMTSV